MKKKKRIDNLQIVSGIVIFLSFLSLILTSSDGSTIEQTYQFPESYLQDGIDPAWGDAINKALKEYQIDVRYPARPWYGKPFILQITLTERDGEINSTEETGNPAFFILDTNLDLKGVEVKPSQRLLLPIQLPQTGFVQWEISTKTSEIEPGKVWISLLPGADAKNSIPVLVLPITIEVRTVCGLKIWMWRVLWVGLGIAGIGILIFRRVKKTKDI